MIDDRTPNLNLPLPHPTNNPRGEDVPRIRQAIAGLDALATIVSDEVAAGNLVSTVAQDLDAGKRAQARENIGARDQIHHVGLKVDEAPSIPFFNPYLIGASLNQAVTSFNAVSENTPELGIQAWLTSEVGEANHATAFKVAIGGYATAKAGSAATFASNFTCQADDGFNSNLYSCELDINWNAGTDAGDIASLTESGALKINGAGSGRSTYGICVAGVYSTQFRNGMVFTGAAGFIDEVGIRFDNSGMTEILRASSSSAVGINLGPATISNGPGNAFIAPPGDGLGVLNAAGTAVYPLIHAAGSNEVLLGSGSFPVLANSPVLAPLSDDTTSLGTSERRFTAVYAVNGTIQTSNPDLKMDVAPLPPVGDLVDSIDPITFRWIDGGTEEVEEEVEEEVIATEPHTVRKIYVAEGIAFEVEGVEQRPVLQFLPVVDTNGAPVMEVIPARPEIRDPKTGAVLRQYEPSFTRQKMTTTPVYETRKTKKMVRRPRPGRRTHWGFDARNVRDAFGGIGVDFGGYVKDGDFEGIRPDQLIPVLWQALKDLRKRVDEMGSAPS